MSDFINLSCPSCGGKIIQQDNQFVCENCRSQYLLRQDGNRINLIPQVVVNVHTGQGDGSHTANKSESVKCPICGRNVDLTNTFQCKRCGREHVCLVHQDRSTFYCQECVSELSGSKITEKSITDEVKKQEWAKRHSAWILVIAIISIISGFVACIYDFKARDYEWWSDPHELYEVITLGALFLHLPLGILSVIFGSIIVKRKKIVGLFAIIVPLLTMLVLFWVDYVEGGKIIF